MAKKVISRAEYKKILSAIPVVCVDLVVVRGKEFLLVKRNHRPAMNKLWLLGGRILKGETFRGAVKRKLKEEGLIEPRNIKKIIQLPAGETFFPDSEFGVSTHTINATFLVEVAEKNKKSVGSDGRLFWFNQIPRGLSPYVKKYLALAGIRA